VRKRINILGATGSVGESALAIVRDRHELYEIGVLAAGSDAKKLAALALEFKAQAVAIYDATKYDELRSLLSGADIEIFAGESGVMEAASISADITLSAIVGFAALKPTLAAIKGSKVLALANKESLVCAGGLVMKAACDNEVLVIPVDSEHNALFQVFEKENATNVDKITITASGGAFRDLTIAQMQNVTPEMALKHPNWNMGAKITVDCATLANKGLEYIETCVLFPVAPEKVAVLMHPQSIIHGMVHYSDGSVLAHLAVPDMRTPIAYAFSYPERIEIPYKDLDLEAIGSGSLTFAAPDYKRFPMLKLAQDSFAAGQDARVAFNTSNEIAVNAFLNKKIGFLDIYKLVSNCVENREVANLNDMHSICEYNYYIYKTVTI
jgi:1-deoxy-D-xylulose-5-phosphate reductoisomerase